MRITSWQCHAPALCVLTRRALFFLSTFFTLSILTLPPLPVAQAHSLQPRYERRMTREPLPHYRATPVAPAPEESPYAFSQRAPAEIPPVMRYGSRTDRATSFQIRAPRPR